MVCHVWPGWRQEASVSVSSSAQGCGAGRLRIPQDMGAVACGFIGRARAACRVTPIGAGA
eukprot:257931-Pyramimonas_sp.AAC.1